MPTTPVPACGGLCTIHAPHLGGTYCELDGGHDDGGRPDGGHLCRDCPEYLAIQRAQQIADRVASHKALHEMGFYTTPDVD